MSQAVLHPNWILLRQVEREAAFPLDQATEAGAQSLICIVIVLQHTLAKIITKVPTSTRKERASLRNPPERHLKSPKIASSSAAGIDTSIEQAEDNLNDLRMRRAAIFSETKDGMLKKVDKAVFWYREGRRQGWQAVASEVMMNEQEWNDQYDRVELERLSFVEEQLESMLEEHKQSFGHGPARQESN
jgi:hypothetical protein